MNYSRQFGKMLSADKDNSALVGFAVISGLAIDAALAVLLAPKKGTELRKGISGGTHQLKEGLADLMAAIRAKFGTDQDSGDHADHKKIQPAHTAPLKNLSLTLEISYTRLMQAIRTTS
jgi:gas vesicle protein